ncbi:uncharacterized protein DNG_04487 [Cephalotrichum gorgonifer]|uniref:Stc1 domain-containing protein n=1 Tax=Cephalotrichum gorgonifer TaxID=2041049 RepID=A0AAE8SUZ1_9PEZI|nr:uncharacterized protein DNG_04487 [Cephalotrichum gorgonifer]
MPDIKSDGGDITRQCMTCTAYYYEENFVRSAEPFGLIRNDWAECNGCKRRTQGASGLAHDEFHHRYQGTVPVGESSEGGYHPVEHQCYHCHIYRPLDNFIRSKEPFGLMVEDLELCNECKRQGRDGDTVELSDAVFAYRYRGGDAVDEGDVAQEIGDEAGEVEPSTPSVGEPEDDQDVAVGQTETRRCGSCRVDRPLDQFVRSGKPFGPIHNRWKSCHRCMRARKGDAYGLSDAVFMHRFQGGMEVTEGVPGAVESGQAANPPPGTRRCGSCRTYRDLDQFVRSSRPFGPIKND